MPLGTLDRTPPPFFRQGPSALTRLMFFAALALFQLLMVVVYPTWIAPLFNQFKPIDDETLKSRVQNLMQRCGFLTNEKEGRKAYYQITEPHLENIMACIEERFDKRAG